MKPLYVVLEWFLFRTLLVQPNDSYTYKEGCSKTIGFCLALLWDETTLLIFEMVSFQALLIQAKDFCISYRGCCKIISFVLFFLHETTFWIFGMVSFQTVLIFVVFLNIWEMQWQKHWLYNGCIRNNNKSIAFITKTNLRTKPKIFVKMDWSKIWPKVVTHTAKSDEIQTGVGGFEKLKFRGTKDITTSFLNIRENLLIWHLNEKGPEQSKAGLLVVVYNATIQLWFHLKFSWLNIMIFAHITNKVNKTIGFVLFLWNWITFSRFHLKLCLEHTRICAWIEKLFAESIAFVMFLWNETTLCIFELVSFQTLLIKPLDCCPYKTRVPKPLVLYCFFEMKPLYSFLTRCHFKLCL